MTDTEQRLRLKRLQYRSIHRGCKETDLILGTFASQNLPHLPISDLETFEALLDEDDAHIWDWLVEKAPTPAAYEALIGAMRSLKLPI